jgi:hypothetical protein
MGLLAQANNTRIPQGVRVAICSQEGVGKTTFVAGAPNPLLIPLEIGYDGVECTKIPMIKDWDALQGLMQEIFTALQAGQFPYKTLIFDSVTALERMIHDKTLSRDPSWGKGNSKAVTMESALGGYGKAYTYANELFDIFLKQCDQLAVYANINIVFTCHAFATKNIDPTVGEFDAWEILLHSPKNNKTYGKRELLTQWVDIMGFLYEPMFISKGDDGVSKGITQGKGRVLGVSRTPAYVAKNRYGMAGEIPIPKADGWNHLANAVWQSSNQTVDIWKR